MSGGKHNVGVIGMAVMGRNLAINLASKGYSVAVFNRTLSRKDEAVKEASGHGVQLHGFDDVQAFCASLEKPRKVIIMVQAGAGVDATLESLLTTLEAGDIVIDGGNEWFRNTERRIAKVHESKLLYLGMGVSGGEEGARLGPALMPGGDPEAYAATESMLAKIAADFKGEACVSFMGRGGAGNYVKMVHNGIEYGDMEIIAETYAVMKHSLKMSNPQMAEIFQFWNAGNLRSFLIEITAKILLKKEDFSDNYLVDLIKDVAGSKGTGKWTAQESAELGIPCTVITAALDQRYLSTMTESRAHFRKVYDNSHNSSAGELTVKDLEDALWTAKVCSYAQGLSLLRKASETYGFSLDLGKICCVWRGGCIIRADMLTDIANAFKANPGLLNLLVDESFSEAVRDKLPSLRKVVIVATRCGIPTSGFSAALSYIDALSATTLPLNLVQAQRDFFGAHTFERVDKEGVHHAQWQ